MIVRSRVFVFAVSLLLSTYAFNLMAVSALGDECMTKGLEVLGEKVGQPIDSGFLFSDGKYVEAPYAVSRRGVNILVNGVVVHTWDLWPLPETEVNEEPALPPGVMTNITLEELQSSAFDTRQWRYLYQHFPESEAQEKMISWYKSFPCVKEVKPMRPNDNSLIYVITTDGKESGVWLQRPRSDSPYSLDFTEEDVITRLEKKRQRFEKSLKRGSCLLQFSNGAQLNLGKDVIAKKFRLMSDILNSSRPTQEKRHLLERLGIIPKGGTEEAFDKLLTNFSATAQFYEHLKELEDATGVQPMRMDDIPKE